MMASRRSTPCRIGVASHAAKSMFDLSSCAGLGGGTAGPSTPTEWQPRRVLARHRGRLVTGRQLPHDVWGRPTRSRPTSWASTSPGWVASSSRIRPTPANRSLNRAWVTAPRRLKTNCRGVTTAGASAPLTPPRSASTARHFDVPYFNAANLAPYCTRSTRPTRRSAATAGSTMSNEHALLGELIGADAEGVAMWTTPQPAWPGFHA